MFGLFLRVPIQNKIILDIPYIRNCEGSKVSPYLEANELHCHCFIDAGRGHETLGSETKNFVTQSNNNKPSSSILLCHSTAPGTPCNSKRARWHLHTPWAALQERKPELRKSESFIVSMLAFCSREKQLSLQRLFTTQTSLKTYSRSKAVNTSAHNKCRTWAIHCKLSANHSHIFKKWMSILCQIIYIKCYRSLKVTLQCEFYFIIYNLNLYDWILFLVNIFININK